MQGAEWVYERATGNWIIEIDGGALDAPLEKNVPWHTLLLHGQI